jgi:histone H3/H4
MFRQIIQGRSHFAKWKRNHQPKQQTLAQRKIRQSMIALRIKKRFQKRSSNLVFPKVTFQRLVRQIGQSSLQMEQIRFQPSAMMALQEATEHFLINLFEDSFQCAIHTHRITVMIQDMLLVHRIRARNFKC